jgi:hypothetical protein
MAVLGSNTLNHSADLLIQRAGTTKLQTTSGGIQIFKNAHTSGASDFHLELFSNNINAANEVSLRMHQASQFFGQIRLRSNGFHFTDGGNNNYRNIFFGTATGSLSGNASTATTATNANKINRNSILASNTSSFRVLLGAASNNSGFQDCFVVTDASRLFYQPSSNTLTCGTFAGALSGNATTATTATNANKINRNSILASNTGSFRVLLGAASNNAGFQDCFVVTDASRLFYQPSSNTLTCGTFAGALSGNATTATTATNANQLGGHVRQSGAATANTVAGRDGSGDIYARLIRQTFANQTTISGGMVFRVNDSTDNYLRVCSDTAAIRTFLDVPTRTGGNASGTWGISVTGNAATVTNGVYTSGNQTISGEKQFTGLIYFGGTNLTQENTTPRWTLRTGANTTQVRLYLCDNTGNGEGNVVTIQRTGSNGTCMRFVRATTTRGSIDVTGSGTSYNTSSDYRIKQNIIPLENSIQRVNNLKVYRFNFIEDPNVTVDGFMAHEAAEVVPEAVTGIKDEVDDEGNPVYQQIDQSKIVPLLTQAIKDLIKKVETLEDRINYLES